MKKLVAMILVASLCLTFFSPLALSQDTVYQQGYEDGKRAASRDVTITNSLIEALWGFLLGPFPVASILLSESKIPTQSLRKIENRSQDYKDGYKAGYRTLWKGPPCFPDSVAGQAGLRSGQYRLAVVKGEK